MVIEAEEKAMALVPGPYYCQGIRSIQFSSMSTPIECIKKRTHKPSTYKMYQIVRKNQTKNPVTDRQNVPFQLILVRLGLERVIGLYYLL